MPHISFAGVAIVAAVALAAPLLLGLAPSLRLPAVVLEIIAGIIIGPSVLSLVTVDLPMGVLALVGVVFILLLAGLEIDAGQLRGRLLWVASGNFLLSFALALLVVSGLARLGLVESPLLVAIILTATSLGIVVPLLKDTGFSGSAFGQLVIAAASIADFATIILLSLFFSREATSPGAGLILLGTFGLLTAAVTLALTRAGRSMRLSAVLVRLQDTTAQIRVRAAFLLLVAFAALAEWLGLEVVFGAFTAGAILKVVDRDEMMTHPNFRLKLEAVGFGVFIPFFFVVSGLRFNAAALFSSAATVGRVPLFFAALLLARGLPALLYRPLLGGRPALVAGLLQATSLPFIVVASQVGMELGMLSEATGAALVAAGLLSVLILPAAALVLLRQNGTAPNARTPLAAPRQ